MTRSRRTACAVATVVALAAAAVFSGAPAQSVTPHRAAAAAPEVREPEQDVLDKPPVLGTTTRNQAWLRSRLRTARSRSAATSTPDPTVGTTKTWLLDDDYYGESDAAEFTMRGLGKHVQVWVAEDDLAYPDGDCRNALGMTTVTDAQVAGLVHEFDANILPKESASFSTAPARNGADGADFAEELGLPADYWSVSSAQSDDLVILVSNVRDADYYDPTSPDGNTYVGGFFASGYNDAFDRNVMTVDAFDWKHRAGANPPDEEADPELAACGASIGHTGFGRSRPRLVESTLAHEYQHLLEGYQDDDEVPWVDEGLAMYAQSLVGYDHAAIAPDQPGAAVEPRIFSGFMPDRPDLGGAENSLTAWGDQGGPEIVSDYGAVYTFTLYLAGRFGTAFMSALHKNPANGLAGLDAVLKARKLGVTAQQVLHEWAAMVAVDGVSGTNGPVGATPGRLKSPRLTSRINWDNPQGYDAPGAPPNGSDYVRLRNATGAYLTAQDLKTLTFDGASTLVPLPLAWTQVNQPPDDTGTMTCLEPGTGTGLPALYSGCADNSDRSLVRPVAVPTADATFTFDALWDVEEGYDYVYPIISGDGGRTWTQLTTEDTVPEGGFNGDSGTWRSETADLSAYAGKNVLIGFRYVSDGGLSLPGFWVRNLQVGTTGLPTSVAGWKSITETVPVRVSGYTVQLVSYKANGNAWYQKLPLGASFHGALTQAQRTKLGSGTTLAAIVTYDDPSESAGTEARYTLKVNGVTQPGG